MNLKTLGAIGKRIDAMSHYGRKSLLEAMEGGAVITGSATEIVDAKLRLQIIQRLVSLTDAERDVVQESLRDRVSPT